MEETVKQEETKTFTQEEVNQIVQDRIFRDRKDRSDYDELKAKAQKFDEMEEASKTELQKATERAEKLEAELTTIKRANEISAMRREVEKETGVPANLFSGDDKETCLAQAKQIMDFFDSKKETGYPTLKDAGEPLGKVKQSTNQQFAECIGAMF